VRLVQPLQQDILLKFFSWKVPVNPQSSIPLFLLSEVFQLVKSPLKLGQQMLDVVARGLGLISQIELNISSGESQCFSEVTQAKLFRQLN
jgi:hypothetical protein